MLHSTGANNPWLRRYVGPDDGLLGPSSNHWNTPTPGGRSVCVHGFIGKLADGSIAAYQTLPWTMRGWHCGSGSRGSGNDTHIGIELCEDNLEDAGYFSAVYRRAVELCAQLCTQFHLSPLADGVILCHAEGYARGIASNHGDVLHWFSRFGKTMEEFRWDVARQMLLLSPELEAQVRALVTRELAEAERHRQALPPSSWAEASLRRAMDNKITDGSRPQDYATRQEVALMVQAALGK